MKVIYSGRLPAGEEAIRRTEQGQQGHTGLSKPDSTVHAS